MVRYRGVSGKTTTWQRPSPLVEAVGEVLKAILDSRGEEGFERLREVLLRELRKEKPEEEINLGDEKVAAAIDLIVARHLPGLAEFRYIQADERFRQDTRVVNAVMRKIDVTREEWVRKLELPEQVFDAFSQAFTKRTTTLRKVGEWDQKLQIQKEENQRN